MREFVFAFIVTLIAAIFTNGCGPKSKNVYIPITNGANEATVQVVTQEGVIVQYPPWLDLPLNAQSKGIAFEEIRTVLRSKPGPDGRTTGVHAGVTVVIRNPGAWPHPSSPTGLVQGLAFIAENRIEVAWTGISNSRPKLPTLSHELEHLITGDPNNGH